MRGRWGRTKRRVAVAALAALTIAVVASLIAPGAGAVVGNPGALKVVMKLTIRTPSLTIEGVSTEGTGAPRAHERLGTSPQASLVLRRRPCTSTFLAAARRRNTDTLPRSARLRRRRRHDRSDQ
jgi:hypothetical protein